MCSGSDSNKDAKQVRNELSAHGTCKDQTTSLLLKVHLLELQSFSSLLSDSFPPYKCLSLYKLTNKLLQLKRTLREGDVGE